MRVRTCVVCASSRASLSRHWRAERTAASKSSSSKGFSMKSTAPSFMASTARGTSACPVMTITGNAKPRAFRRRRNAMPSIRGMRTSVTTQPAAASLTLSRKAGRTRGHVRANRPMRAERTATGVPPCRRPPRAQRLHSACARSSWSTARNVSRKVVPRPVSDLTAILPPCDSTIVGRWTDRRPSHAPWS